MTPTSPGAFAQISASYEPIDEDEKHNQSPPSGKERKTSSPRMVQVQQESEEDGMEVDNSDDDRARIEDRIRHPKRDRDNNEGSQDTHSEPKLKRQRTCAETSPGQHKSEQSPSSSPSSSSSSIAPTASGTSAAPARLIRRTLDSDAVKAIQGDNSLNMTNAAHLLFGEETKEWPAGFSLLSVADLTPELEQVFVDSGVCVLWNGSSHETSSSLVIFTPESDRKSLQLGLLQIHTNESGNQPERAEIDDEDSDDNSVAEEFVLFPIGTHSTALTVAAAIGDPDLLSSLLATCGNPNQRDSNGETALIIAARLGHIRVVRLLLRDHRTKVNLVTPNVENALCHAAAQGHLEICSLLLGFGGAQLEKRMTPGMITHPLLLAASNGHHAICKLIINQGVDINLHNNLSETALSYAATNGHIECCKQLLDAGADINHVDISGLSILCRAIAVGNLEVFELLIERGALLTNKNTDATPLTTAAQSAHANIVQRLIELKVDLDENRNGETALRAACFSGSIEVVTALLEAGANPDIPDLRGFNSLVYAAASGSIELLNLILKHGAKLRSKGHFGYLALREATKGGHLDAIELLLLAKAPTAVPRNSYQLWGSISPLISCALNSKSFPSTDLQSFAVNSLLMHGASWSEVDADGYDALMSAAAFGHPLVTRRLIMEGANIGQLNAKGLNALEIAASYVDLKLNLASGVADETMHVIYNLLHMLEGAKCQHNWLQLRAAAINKAEHPITREILCQSPAYPDQGNICAWDINTVVFNVSPQNRASVFAIVNSACLESIDDWDRTETEIQLAQAGIPVPAIDFYCAYINAFPAMKVKLFGATPTSRITPDFFVVFVNGITATMEKLLMDEGGINTAYEALAWHPIRGNLVDTAHTKISEASSAAMSVELQLQTVFVDLFDHCLQPTLTAQSAARDQRRSLPRPGAIAAELMNHRVYAVLAEDIEKAWRVAWVETIMATSAAPSASSSSSEFYSGIESSSLFASSSITSTNLIGSQLSDQESSQLMKAFRKALSRIVDSANLLKLPDASAEVAGLYADLVHRQLHMVAQFIKGETEVEVQALPEEWVVDWTGTNL